jgi:dihydrofolate reductase
MQPLRYSINITIDGCCDHRVGVPDAALHQHAADSIAAADVLLFGRTVYQMMESFWRPLAETGEKPDDFPDWMMPFAHAIHGARKYVVSDTLASVDWNAELVRGNQLEETVRRLKAQEGRGIFTGGVMLPLALAEMGLIDSYEFVVQPRLAGHGPTPFAGLSRIVQLRLVDRLEFPSSGSVALRYEPQR